MSGLGFLCACGSPDAAGEHSAKHCALAQPAPADDAQRLAEFRARLEFVANGLDTALEQMDRSNAALQAMLRDVKAWSRSLGGGA